MVIVLVDGLRVDTAANQAVMPHLNELRNLGASAVMHSRAPSFSEAGYSTLMIGAWPEINDGPIFNLEYDQIPTWTQDNLFSAAHRKGVQTAVSGYYWFEKLLPPQDVDLHFYTPKIDRTADQDVLAAALPWLQADDAGLVLIHLDQVISPVTMRGDQNPTPGMRLLPGWTPCLDRSRRNWISPKIPWSLSAITGILMQADMAVRKRWY